MIIDFRNICMTNAQLNKMIIELSEIEKKDGQIRTELGNVVL